MASEWNENLKNAIRRANDQRAQAMTDWNWQSFARKVVKKAIVPALRKAWAMAYTWFAGLFDGIFGTSISAWNPEFVAGFIALALGSIFFSELQHAVLVILDVWIGLHRLTGGFPVIPLGKFFLVYQLKRLRTNFLFHSNPRFDCMALWTHFYRLGWMELGSVGRRGCCIGILCFRRECDGTGGRPNSIACKAPKTTTTTTLWFRTYMALRWLTSNCIDPLAGKYQRSTCALAFESSANHSHKVVGSLLAIRHGIPVYDWFSTI
jgi:hypothetical protein